MRLSQYIGDLNPDAHVKGFSGFSLTALTLSKYPAIFAGRVSIFGCQIMKIFSNQFSLRLRVAEIFPEVGFESHPFEDAIKKIGDSPLFDSGQVIFAQAGSGLRFVEKVVEFQTRDEVGLWPVEMVLIFDNEEKLNQFKADYSTFFRFIQAAGGLVTNPKGELLMIYRQGFWDLPKGKLDKGERVDDAAMREVEEETGIESHLLQGLIGSTFHIFQRSSGWSLKETVWYEMKTWENEILVPQEEEGITEIKWWSVDELSNGLPGTWPMIRELVKRFCLKHKA
jgi:8-oxo-dGTP pyrophosphatase MutT (NUDIX family)